MLVGKIKKWFSKNKEVVGILIIGRDVYESYINYDNFPSIKSVASIPKNKDKPYRCW